MENNSNFTNQESTDYIISSLSSTQDTQDKFILGNTLIFVLISTIVVYLFFRLFCKFNLFKISLQEK